MKSKIIAAVLAATLLLGQAAGAAEFVPAPNARYVIDLDTPDDRISHWQLDDLSGLSAMRAQVTTGRIGKVTAVKPGALLALSNGRSEVHLRFLFTPEGSTASLTVWRGDESLPGEAFLAPLDPEETFGLEIAWTPEGVVTVRIAGKAAKEPGSQGFEEHVVTMDGAPTRLEIIGAAGEVEFKPLILGAVR